jgi:DNA-binding PadR family transcriptional regulator
MLHFVKHIRTPADSRSRPAPSPAAATLGEFEQLVLFSLVRLGDGAYGALVRRDIERRTGRDLSISAVYVTVARLELKGYLRTRVGDPTPERGGRRRKLVELLPAGRQAATLAYRQLRAMTDGLERQFDAP